MSNICRGDILHADLNPTVGSEQAGSRPVIVIQTFHNSTMILVAPITSRKKGLMRTHVSLKGIEGLDENSIALLEQMRSIDKGRIAKRIGDVPDFILEQLLLTYKKMGKIDFEREPMLMTLCGRCASEYRNAKNYLKRADFNQTEKESCMHCNVKTGWDYFIYNR